ncbi:MAG: single-stranded-DNA-specific exonuclease RecJ [Proteobacteria bacterium]|nr:single-stranded-DNA-specific exonuclease RecJ [Pseudomonadota bacterium]
MPGAATWTVKKTNQGQVSELAAALDVGVVTASCLINRGLSEPAAARTFLEPRLADLQLPDGMADLERAADRLADAVLKRERVAVFGDYDVDGISSAALVTLFLNEVGVQTETLFADRFSGYGMGAEMVDHFIGLGCSLIIAVDCGTSDHTAAERAVHSGTDIVVVDHHHVEGPHPNVYAFVNPERNDCHFGDTTLAAVGLAFYFVAATRKALCARGHIRRSDVDLKSWLDLVALGTVADVMPLKGNNRILAFHGLRQISRMPRYGLKSLIRTARIRSPEIRADHIAFQLAPRLNAAGRLSQAKEAFDLLMSTSFAEADLLAARLDYLSQQRRSLEENVLNEARLETELNNLASAQLLTVAGDGWHRGVLGIVAARIVEWTGKPAFVIGFDGDTGIGSARGRGQIDLYEALNAASSHLIRFGGHRDAAGFTIQRNELDGLKQALKKYAETCYFEVGPREIVCDMAVSPAEINATLLREISLLGPFGASNKEPILEIDGLYVLDSKVVGRDHLKLELKTPSGSIAAFGPRMGELSENTPPLIRVAANLITDEWRGDGTPELRLVAPPVPGN